MRGKKAIKWYMVSKIEFERERGEGNIETHTTYFRSECFAIRMKFNKNLKIISKCGIDKIEIHVKYGVWS